MVLRSCKKALTSQGLVLLDFWVKDAASKTSADAVCLMTHSNSTFLLGKGTREAHQKITTIQWAFVSQAQNVYWITVLISTSEQAPADAVLSVIPRFNQICATSCCRKPISFELTALLHANCLPSNTAWKYEVKNHNSLPPPHSRSQFQAPWVTVMTAISLLCDTCVRAPWRSWQLCCSLQLQGRGLYLREHYSWTTQARNSIRGLLLEIKLFISNHCQPLMALGVCLRIKYWLSAWIFHRDARRTEITPIMQYVLCANHWT